MEKKEKGNIGEEIAAAYLKKNGYRILDRNFSCRFGEIDLIADDCGTLVFVEVKLRKNDRFAEAREFVDRNKQKKILQAARYYLMKTGTECPMRFDVTEIYLDPEKDRVPEIRHIPDAFE